MGRDFLARVRRLSGCQVVSDARPSSKRARARSKLKAAWLTCNDNRWAIGRLSVVLRTHARASTGQQTDFLVEKPS